MVARQTDWFRATSKSRVTGPTELFAPLIVPLHEINGRHRHPEGHQRHPGDMREPVLWLATEHVELIERTCRSADRVRRQSVRVALIGCIAAWPFPSKLLSGRLMGACAASSPTASVCPSAVPAWVQPIAKTTNSGLVRSVPF